MKVYLLFLVFAVFSIACSHQSTTADMDKEEIQAIMQDVSRRNLARQTLSERDGAMMQRAVEYYKKNGTSNELMEAYYLLGSVYRDLHEAPKAMTSFQEGVNSADTLDGNCRYDILTRIHAQISELLIKQNSYRLAILEENRVSKYALLANDTSYYFNSQWTKLGLHYHVKDYECVANECWKLLKESTELNRYNEAAAMLIPSVLANVRIGQVDDAQRLLRIYEKYSGDVDLSTYKSSFPVYYYAKGCLFLLHGELDSATMFFNKELAFQDWNNRQMAYRGLHEVYKRKADWPMAYKYARLQCEAVDSDYQTMVTANIQNLHELYDYSRAEKENHQKSMQLEQEHQRMVRIRWTLVLVLLVALFVFYYLHARYEKKIARAELELEKAANEHEEAEYRLLELQKKLGLANSDEERAELEKEMQQAEEESALQRKRVLDRQEYLDELRRRVRLTKKDLRQRQFDEPLFRTLLRKSKEGQNATEQDYADMVTFLQKKDVGLVDRFYAAAPMATDMEFKVFLLMRMGMTKAEIATLTSHETNSISMVMNRFFKKVNKRNPESSAEADRWLLEI